MPMDKKAGKRAANDIPHVHPSVSKDGLVWHGAQLRLLEQERLTRSQARDVTRQMELKRVPVDGSGHRHASPTIWAKGDRRSRQSETP
jgi:hypothetical protein